MKQTLVAAAWLAVAALVPAQAEVITLDRVVAVVNKQVITDRDLQERVKSVMQNMNRQGVNPPPMDNLRAQALERMISDSVLAQQATETGIRVDDTVLDRTLERLAEQNRLSLAQFKVAIEQEGLSFARFREDIRQEIMISRLKEREVDNRVQVTEAEIDAYLKRQAENKTLDEDFQLAHILVKVPEQASQAEVSKKRLRIEAAAEDLKAGKPFNEVAAIYSEAPDALKGGELGWRNASRLPSLFLDALTPLKPGQVTAIIRSPNGFHLIRMIDRKSASENQIIAQTKVRHILVKVNEAVSESDAKARIERVRERLLNGGKFVELARLFSEDGSANQGGDLGWVSPGDLVPEFEKVMDTLKPDELSEPVRSPFGWHLIQVQDRRNQDVTQDRERMKVRQALKAKKAEEYYDDWIRQLRDRAYVENRLVEE